MLYISIHRYEGGTFYPCGELGGPKSCGKGAGLGLWVLKLQETRQATADVFLVAPSTSPGPKREWGMQITSMFFIP